MFHWQLEKTKLIFDVIGKVKGHWINQCLMEINVTCPESWKPFTRKDGRGNSITIIHIRIRNKTDNKICYKPKITRIYDFNDKDISVKKKQWKAKKHPKQSSYGVLAFSNLSLLEFIGFCSNTTIMPTLLNIIQRFNHHMIYRIYFSF